MELQLWRTSENGPVWACTVIEARTPGGYEISDIDSSVADPEFMGAMAGALARPQNVVSLIDGGKATSVVTVLPGESGHLGAALRAIPGTMISKRK